MQYLVVFEKSADGSTWARVPDLPGCFSCGETIDQAREKIKEAIELHIQVMKEEGIPIPEVSHLKAELIALQD
ncbi:MAG: type II toxin-antitoxin system HicB family antitoxin [Flavisolibacter sp.]|nr:type II toxin-antitoxin system HicB family antitoxin [Flavisolibacter sp.]